MWCHWWQCWARDIAARNFRMKNGRKKKGKAQESFLLAPALEIATVTSFQPYFPSATQFSVPQDTEQPLRLVCLHRYLYYLYF